MGRPPQAVGHGVASPRLSWGGPYGSRKTLGQRSPWGCREPLLPIASRGVAAGFSEVAAGQGAAAAGIGPAAVRRPMRLPHGRRRPGVAAGHAIGPPQV